MLGRQRGHERTIQRREELLETMRMNENPYNPEDVQLNNLRPDDPYYPDKIWTAWANAFRTAIRNSRESAGPTPNNPEPKQP